LIQKNIVKFSQKTNPPAPGTQKALKPQWNEGFCFFGSQTST